MIGDILYFPRVTYIKTMLRPRKNCLYVVGVIIKLHKFKFYLLIIFLLDKTFKGLNSMMVFLLKFEYLN